MEKHFVEKDCKIEHEGKTFESGGSYLLPCTDGKIRGAVYVSEENMRRVVTTWHGEVIAPATWTDYQGNFCRMRRVSFTWQGRKFVGDYCPDWSELVKVRSTK
jgi:hypothetical protein